jgi:hypothetical protein
MFDHRQVIGDELVYSASQNWKKKGLLRSGFFGGWGGVGVFKVEKIGIFFYNLDSKKKIYGFI